MFPFLIICVIFISTFFYLINIILYTIQFTKFLLFIYVYIGVIIFYITYGGILMRIEKLNENKIRIVLNMEDLAERNIDFQSFMSNSIDSQDLFYDMLDEAEEKIGFITKDYKLSIEALATSEGNFILTVTRMKPDSSLKSSKKKMSAKRKSIKLDKNIYIYSFDNFDNFCEFCTCINNTHLKNNYKSLSHTYLYLFESHYHLVIKNLNMSLNDFKALHCFITEFGKFESNGDLFENKLKEYGKVIFNKNAISTCAKYFTLKKQID